MFHQVVILGNLGSDPEMRYTPSGRPVTNFSVASNKRYTNSSGEQVDQTTWFRVACWGKLAEVTNDYLSKGRQVFIIGELSPGENGSPKVWTGTDGEAHASYEVNAQMVKFLGRPNGGDNEEVFSEAGKEISFTS